MSRQRAKDELDRRLGKLTLRQLAHFVLLLFKMRHFGINPNLIVLIRSYLSVRTFRIKRFGEVSAHRSMRADVL